MENWNSPYSLALPSTLSSRLTKVGDPNGFLLNKATASVPLLLKRDLFLVLRLALSVH